MEPYVRSEEATKRLQESRRARWRQRYAEDKVYYNEVSKKHYDAHKDEILAKNRAKYASDPELREKNKEKGRKWREANKERISEYNRQYRESQKSKQSYE